MVLPNELLAFLPRVIPHHLALPHTNLFLTLAPRGRSQPQMELLIDFAATAPDWCPSQNTEHVQSTVKQSQQKTHSRQTACHTLISRSQGQYESIVFGVYSRELELLFSRFIVRVLPSPSPTKQSSSPSTKHFKKKQKVPPVVGMGESGWRGHFCAVWQWLSSDQRGYISNAKRGTKCLLHHTLSKVWFYIWSSSIWIKKSFVPVYFV